MALTKQIFPVALRQGMDTKTDPKSLVPGQFITLENVVFQNPGKFTKRFGYVPEPTAILNSPISQGFITNGQALMSYLEEMVLCDTSYLYSLSQASSAWVYKAPFTSVNVTTYPVIRDGYQQTAADQAITATGLALYAWEDTNLGLAYKIIDTTDNLTVVQPTIINADGCKPKVFLFRNQFVVVYYRTDTTKLYIGVVSALTPTATMVSTAITSTGGAASQAIDPSNPTFDAEVVQTVAGPQLYVSFRNAVSAAYGITTYSFGLSPPPWLASTAYVVGNFVVNGTNVYICKTSGTSASSGGPTGTGSDITDGTAHWTYYNAIGTLTSPSASAVYADITPTAITVFADWIGPGNPSGGIVIGYYDGTNVNVISYDQALNLTLIATQVETIANVVSLTGVSTSTAARDIDLFYTVSTATSPVTSQLTRIRSCSVTGAGYVIGTPADLRRSVALAAKAFNYNGTAYVPAAFQSNFQSGYYLIDSSAHVDAKAFSGTGGGMPAVNAGIADYGNFVLPETVALANGTSFTFPCLVQDMLSTLPTMDAQTGTQIAPSLDPVLTAVFTLTGIEAATFNFFDPIYSYPRAQLCNNLLVGGGFIQTYDGTSVTEQNFHVGPELKTSSASAATTGGFVQNGTAYYVVCYQSIDAYGQTDISAPSVSIPVTTTGSNVSKVTLTIPTYRLGNKSNVTIMVYRNIVASGGTVFYQCINSITPVASGGVNAPIINDPTVDTVTFHDELNDSILGNVQLYTTGNVVINGAPPPVSCLAVNQNTCFALDSTNPLSIWFSETAVPGTPAVFSPWFTINADPRGGPVTGMAAMDTNLIIFKEDSIFYISGSPPDNTGNNWGFSDAQYLSTTVGCTNPRSVIYTEKGVFFQAANGKGIWQQGRDLLSNTYVGAPVEAYNNDTVTSVDLIDNTTQIRFTLSSGVALVYDYYVSQWSVFTNIDAVDSIIYQGAFSYLQPGGTVMVETPGVFSDNGTYISMKFVTSWLSLAAIQGFQRIYEFELIGSLLSQHTLVVSTAVDFNPATVQTLSIPSGSVSVYGASSPYGNESPFGGAFPQYEWRILPNIQKCTSMQITVQDIQSGTTIGQSLDLSAITLLVGKKTGLNKFGQAFTAG